MYAPMTGMMPQYAPQGMQLAGDVVPIRPGIGDAVYPHGSTNYNGMVGHYSNATRPLIRADDPTNIIRILQIGPK